MAINRTRILEVVSKVLLVLAEFLVLLRRRLLWNSAFSLSIVLVVCENAEHVVADD